MKKDLEILEEGNILSVNGINFEIIGNFDSSYHLKRSDQKQMCIRKVPLKLHPERLTNAEISFLKISPDSHFLQPGVRRLICRTEN